jgi:hypothetical protein
MPEVSDLTRSRGTQAHIWKWCQCWERWEWGTNGYAELARGAKGLIRMENDQTILEPPEVSSSSSKATGKKPQVFSFGE